MTNKLITEKVLSIIRSAHKANDDDLKLLRNELIEVLNEAGPKQFVTVIAEIMKDKFRVENCSDIRIPLKRLFSVSLEEAEEAVERKNYGLPEDHPISTLLREHLLNIYRLKRMKPLLEKAVKVVLDESVLTQLKEINVYFIELDSHIRKEEEVLFPALVERGMKEHPDTLKEEHKKFKEIISETVDAINKRGTKEQLTFNKKITQFNNEFLPGMANHIFRETYILYPAAIEFIPENSSWSQLKKRFNTIEKSDLKSLFPQ